LHPSHHRPGGDRRVTTAAEARAASHTLLYFLIAAMVFFWSANYIVGKIALREFPPVLLAGLRICLAGLFILPAYAMQKGAASWGKRDLPMLLYLGLFGVTLNQ